jgi:N6-L-threonylcarbamoyladenine synthase
MSIILGIETSCDETGIAIVADGQEVLANEVASQIDIHKEFGGVVPEIASREHTTIISQLTREALNNAGFHDAPEKNIDAIAVTRGPGLMGSLLVGMSFAKGLAYAWSKPFIPVHHIEGHLYSTFLAANPPQFPFLALIVSGGHTQLIQCPKPHRYEILGSTRDDAVGESFDKVARLLGLPYPGGPSIQETAKTGNPNAFALPRPMIRSRNLEFSYSGLKTAVLYTLRDHENANTADLAASFQQAAVDILLIKTKQAVAETHATRLVVAGGVAANSLLRERLACEIDVELHIPPLEYCLDNGAMIAAAGEARLRAELETDLSITPKPNLILS